MNCTKIEWVKNPDGSRGFTWNPITGCRGDCPYCYARKIAKRFKQSFEPAVHYDRMKQPERRKKPSTIFVCSASDLLGEWVADHVVHCIISILKNTPQHTYLLLTKNPKRYADFKWPDNCWLGATATNQEQWHKACAAFGYRLLAARRKRFISCEPLLEEIQPGKLDHLNVDWLILGALTTPRPQPVDTDWLLRLYDWAGTNGIPVFMKDNLAPSWPGDLTQQMPAGIVKPPAPLRSSSPSSSSSAQSADLLLTSHFSLLTSHFKGTLK